MTKARDLADLLDGSGNLKERAGGRTLSGRNVRTDGGKLDGIEASATADQTKSDIDALNINADLLDGQHGAYYTGYTDTAVANIVDSSPAALNTLNELAAALGDDPNFATTTSTNIGTKLPKSGGAMTGAITTNSTFDGRNVSVDGTKLDGIEASANVTDTVNVVAALTAGSNITIASDGTIAGAAQYTHPTHAGDDAAIDTGALSGATVISDLDLNITTDTLGHVTDANATVATRNLTLGNLGYTGATNANYITNNNQLTNGAGYTTSVGDITGVTAGTNLTGGGTSGGVTVNLTASPNVTSLSVGSSEVISSARQLKNIASVDATTVAALNSSGVGPAVASWQQVGSTKTYAGATNHTQRRNMGSVTMPNWTKCEGLYVVTKYDTFASSGNYRGAKIFLSPTNGGPSPLWGQYYYYPGASSNNVFTLYFPVTSDDITARSDPPTTPSPTIDVVAANPTIVTEPSHGTIRLAGQDWTISAGSDVYIAAIGSQTPISIGNISVKVYAKWV